MARMSMTRTALLAGVAAALALPATASAQIGGFETEITKSKKKAKVTKQDIVDVRLDPSWKGPRSIEEALDLVKDNGEIVVHPGVYSPEHIKLRKSVTIRGIRDGYGEAPTLVANGGCLSISSDKVSARVTDVTFRATEQTCVSVSKGHLDLASAEIRGKHAGYGNRSAYGSHLRAFSEGAATSSRSALVSIKGGRVSIENSKLVGGETGVMINPGSSGNAFEHVSLRENTIAQMTGAGVVMVGNVDATLASNSILQNGLGGVVYSASGHARLVGNIISNNAHNGLYIVGNGEAVSVERNQIHDNDDDGIEVRSGIAILVGNDIGQHDGCMVNENAFATGTSEHLSRPPIQLLADAQGVSTYRTRGGCERAQPEDRRRRRNSRGR